MPQRDLYIDRLRSVVTAIVILHHTAITYGAMGGWYYDEVRPSPSPTSLLLTLFTATNQAWFMGLFFFLAGYFTPGSLERKGYVHFICDRFLRLGVPYLVFGYSLGPLTVALADSAQGHGILPTFVWLERHRQFVYGPLWFAQALLMFCMAYCAWRFAIGRPLATAQRISKAVPGFAWWLICAVAVGAFALLIRQRVPVGQNVIRLQLGYFSSYTFLFALGIAAWRYEWLRQLSWKNARPWVIGLILTWPVMPIAMYVANATMGPGKANFWGGLSWPAIVYAFWEPFVAWGIIAALLLVFRKHMNEPSALWSWLNRRAYAVYIIHPPILVGISLLMHSWAGPALLKFAIVGSLSCVTCWLIADPLVRLPGLRRVI